MAAFTGDEELNDNQSKFFMGCLNHGSGTNTLDALLTAYGDPGCDAVVLVTDGLPDQRPEEILDHVAYASHGRPVHAIYLAHSETDTVIDETAWPNAICLFFFFQFLFCLFLYLILTPGTG